MDTGNALGNDALYTQIHGVDGRMLTAGALSVVLTADDDGLAQLPCSLRELRIITVVAILGHERDVGAHAGELCTCRCDIVCGNVVSSLERDTAAKVLLRLLRYRQELDVRSLDYLYLRRFLLRQRLDQHRIIHHVMLRLVNLCQLRHVSAHHLLCAGEGAHDGCGCGTLRGYQVNVGVRRACTSLEVTV